MNKLAELHSHKGSVTLVGYDFHADLKELAESGHTDCGLFATFNAFSPLGAEIHFFSDDLGIDETDIIELAEWNENENPDVAVIGLQSRRSDSKLRGVVLASSETSRCYRHFTSRFGRRSDLDFYYSIAYECISYASKTLGAKKIAMSHLTGSNKFNGDIASCTAEALGNFSDKMDSPHIESFLFFGCCGCIKEQHLYEIRRLRDMERQSSSSEIRTVKSVKNGFEVVSIHLE